MLLRIFNLLLLELPISLASSRPRLWIIHSISPLSILLSILTVLFAILLYDGWLDIIYISYFTIGLILLFHSSKIRATYLLRLWYVVLILIGLLQYIGYLPNFWRDSIVESSYACGFSSEPSFFALSLYWLVLTFARKNHSILLHVLIIFFLTRSYSVILCAIVYFSFSRKIYYWIPYLVLSYLAVIALTDLPSIGYGTLFIFGSWRELATESMLMANMLGNNHAILEAVYRGQELLNGTRLDWIDTSYSLISILSMWTTYFALYCYLIFIKKAKSLRQKHLIFLGFFFVPKWMLFYLILIEPSDIST